MSYEHIERKALKAEALRVGQSIFQSNIPCKKCGGYAFYTKQKGYVCVSCHSNKKKQHTQENIEEVRKQKRESYNRNRPSHNAEKMVIDAVKAAGFLEVAPITQKEMDGLWTICDFLKNANGTEGGCVIDHIHPKAGFLLDGVKVYGRTTPSNLRVITKEDNAKKTNTVDTENIKFNSRIHAVKDNTVTTVSALSSTEEIRELFSNMFQVKTRRSNDSYGKLKDGTEQQTGKRKVEALSLYDVMRRYLVLELMLGGIDGKYLFKEPHPLRDVWDDDKGRYVTPVVRTEKGLHSPEQMQVMYTALRWADAAIDCLYWKNKGMPLPDVFNDDDILQRIEQHFIEWVNVWTLNKEHGKPIYDFLKIPGRDERESFKNQHFKKKDATYTPPAEQQPTSKDKVKVITQSQADDMKEFFGDVSFKVVPDAVYYSLPQSMTFFRLM